MSELPPAKDIPAESTPVAADGSTAPTPAPGPATNAPEALTPEEQMERFAKQLKEDDWGHQPC